MRDLIQKIDNILKESVEEDNGLFQIGDEFGISFSEDLEIATTIVGFVEDGIVVELDDTAIGIMESNGARFIEGRLEEGLRDPKDNPCWKGYKPVGTKKKGGRTVPNCVPKESIGDGIKESDSEIKSAMTQIANSGDDGYDMMIDGMNGALGKHVGAFLQNMYSEIAVSHGLHPDDDFERIYDRMLNQIERDYGTTESIASEAEYQGRDVPLGKKMAGDVKKYKVYVKNPQGNVVKVNFGDKKMRIKKSNPERRKSFRARHNCDNPGPRHKARYWSCRNW